LISLQAIAIAGCFMNEGSILVVCPAILRIPWAEELERWLPVSSPSDIHLGNILSLYATKPIVLFLSICGVYKYLKSLVNN
jgi:hypothetical protein